MPKQYERTSWVNEQTPLNASNMNNIEEGILEALRQVGQLPDWVINGEKPTYTPEEVGADPSGTAQDKINAHNGSPHAHENFLAKKEHTHTLEEITNFPVPSDTNSALISTDGVTWNTATLSNVAFSGSYNDLQDKPTIPTRTSELINDAGFVRLEDVRQTAYATYNGGYLNEEKEFIFGFKPTYVSFYRYRDDTLIDVETLHSEIDTNDLKVKFTDLGVTAYSKEYGKYNEIDYNYRIVAVREVSGGETNLPVITVEDNGKLLTAYGGEWIVGERAHIFISEQGANETAYDSVIRVVGTSLVYKGDLAIAKRTIVNGKIEYTAFVYNGTQWQAMDGNYSTRNVYFEDDLITTSAIGNITLHDGQATINAKGKNIDDVWESIFVKEDTDISVVKPKTNATSGSVKYLVVGASDTQNITVNLTDGTYEYGYALHSDDTPVSVEEATEGNTAEKVSTSKSAGTAVSNYNVTYNGSPVTSTTNVFAVNSGTQNITASRSATINIAYTKGNVPVSNLKKMYPSKAISAGTTANVTKELFRWYMPMYAGFRYSNNLISDIATITATQLGTVPTTSASSAYTKSPPTSATATKNWRQYVLGIPKVFSKSKPSILDSNNLPLTVETANEVTITKNGVDIVYNVWYINLASDYETKRITIKW